jgi:Zn-dependent metalloprotease
MCNCKIIPDYVLEELKEKGLDINVDSISISNLNRINRSAALIRRQLFGAVLGQSNAYVYDSQHGSDHKNVLLRKQGGQPVADLEANKVYDSAQIIKKYFLEELEWDSIDNHGMDLIFNIHFQNNYANAFWDGDDMTFGDGDDYTFVNFTSAIDVIAHELTHGVVQYTSKLIYDGQPGALNEHMADVFGTAVKQYAMKQDENTADWLLGDQIMGAPLQGRAIRSLKDPGGNVPLSAQPAHMSQYYSGSADNHGVHINSGIPNKAFYLVSMQLGTFNAAKLWFAALKKLSPTSDFKSLYAALASVVSGLQSNNILPGHAQKVIDDAFSFVGII